MCRIWCVSSVPKPESTTRRVSAWPSPSCREIEQFGAVGRRKRRRRRAARRSESANRRRRRSSCRHGRHRWCLRGPESCRSLSGRADLRIGFAAGDPETALGIEIDFDRLLDQRIGRPKVDLETIGDLQRLPLLLRIVRRHVFGIQITLGEGDVRRASEKAEQEQRGDRAPGMRLRSAWPSGFDNIIIVDSSSLRSSRLRGEMPIANAARALWRFAVRPWSQAARNRASRRRCRAVRGHGTNKGR